MIYLVYVLSHVTLCTYSYYSSTVYLLKTYHKVLYMKIEIRITHLQNTHISL